METGMMRDDAKAMCVDVDFSKTDRGKIQ